MMAQQKESPCNAADTGDAGSVLSWEDPLEEEIATHSNIHAWKIPRTEKPVGLRKGVTKSQT